MHITSSRKPSAGTRTLCKHLASFFGFEYFNRGKMSMGEVLSLSHGNPLLIVGEYHGNPGSLAFYDGEGFCTLSIYISVLEAPSDYPKKSNSFPLIIGDNELVPVIKDLIVPDDSTSSKVLSLTISGNQLDFKEGEYELFSLRMKSYKVFEVDEECS
jgi:U3 small nucleolar ribonucleoprotein protein IMP4